jgi:DNA-binding NarL/FixJ family response regulator
MLWGLQRLIESNQAAMQVVGSASSCGEALALLKNATADMILLDLSTRGEDLLAEIPRLAESEARILLLTRSEDQALQDQAILAGANGILGKDTSPEMALMAIAKVHEGQVWLDRVATGRIFVEFSRRAANQPAANDPETHKISSLTERERKVVLCILENAGDDGKSIAQKLRISESTLRNHLTSIYEKIGVANRHGLVAYGQKHRLVSKLG